MNCATYFYNCIQFPLEISQLICTYFFLKKSKRFQFVARFGFFRKKSRNQNRKRLNRFRDRWGWEITSFIFFTFPDVPRLLSPCMVAPSRAIILPTVSWSTDFTCVEGMWQLFFHRILGIQSVFNYCVMCCTYCSMSL